MLIPWNVRKETWSWPDLTCSGYRNHIRRFKDPRSQNFNFFSDLGFRFLIFLSVCHSLVWIWLFFKFKKTGCWAVDEIVLVEISSSLSGCYGRCEWMLHPTNSNSKSSKYFDINGIQSLTGLSTLSIKADEEFHIGDLKINKSFMFKNPCWIRYSSSLKK